MLDMIVSVLGLFILPLALIAWFVVSLVMFLRCQKEETEKRKNWRFSLIISSVIIGLAAVCLVALMVLFAMAIMFM